MSFPVHVSVDRLDRAVSRGLERRIATAVPEVAPALALSVWRAGECRFDAHAGWLDPEGAALPVHADVLFDLASLTKLFTGTAFLRLVSEGRIGLDDPVAATIPAFAEGGPRRVDGGQEPLSRRVLPTPSERAGWRTDPGTVTFRQLLTHTGGLAPWRSIFRAVGPVPPPPGVPEPVPIEARWAAGLEAVYRARFVGRPGEEVRYSDLGFIVLGAAVRLVTGRQLEAAVEDLVVRPLGLSTAGYRPLDAGHALDRVVPTSIDTDWRGRRCHGEVEDENAAGLGGVAGHAGLFASAGDVARFGEAWRSADARLGLDPDLIAEAVSDRTPGLDEARGLGWQVQPTDHLAPFGPRAFGHTGFTGTSLAVDPERELVVALLTNRVYAGRTHEGIDELRLSIHEAVSEAFA